MSGDPDSPYYREIWEPLRVKKRAVPQSSDQLMQAIYHLRRLFPLLTPSSSYGDTELVPRSYLRQPTCGEIRKIAAFLDRHDPSKNRASAVSESTDGNSTPGLPQEKTNP